MSVTLAQGREALAGEPREDMWPGWVWAAPTMHPSQRDWVQVEGARQGENLALGSLVPAEWE